jgi:iron complex outermembrane receptor protein
MNVEKKLFCRILFGISAVFICHLSHAQNVLKGRITDASDGSGVIGANIIIKGTTTGATTDFDGDFELKISADLPVTIVISSLGYQSQELKVTDVSKRLNVKLSTTNVELNEVTVLGSRISEKQKESPLTVESLDVIAIKETPAANFYEGLGALKGVDVTAASLGFRIINTRGFNSTSPVRSLQIIDGVDNQAPGLNFSLGNFLGASELDVENVEIIVGASSAQYGPNAFNGVVSMTTKDPFIFQGISAMAKVGERNLRETAVRYAKAVKIGKVDYENLAIKLNLFYMQANDWEADNYDPTLQSITPKDHPGGYDAINRYADERYFNDFNSNSGLLTSPGMRDFYRTGYEEKDLVDYNTNNLKASGAVHFKVKPNIQLKYGYNFGTGTTVYQGDNRYSLRNIMFTQHKVELRGENFFVRAYNTAEDAGESYDAVFTALLLNRAGKPDVNWRDAYDTYWRNNITPLVRGLPGFPPNDSLFIPPNFDINPRYFNQANSVINQNQDQFRLWHLLARDAADRPGLGFPGRLNPGTEAFQTEFDRITSSRSFLEGGSRFFDRSALSHIHGEYNFKPEFMDIKVGGNYRQYRPNSAGTIFSDTNGRVITNQEFGFYSQLEKKFLAKRLKVTAAGRVDKNENFDFIASPALSAVYVVKKNHTYRFSFSSAIRNPTLQDQFLYYNVGRALLLGNLDGRKNVLTIDNYLEYATSQNFDTTLLKPFDIDPIRPEKVRSLEIGYKGTLWNKVFVDASAFYSWYTDFIGFRIVADQPAFQGQFTNVYRISSNARDQVHTKGASVGLTYFVGKYYALTGNYTYNELDRRGSTDPIIPAFNTPANKFNIGFNGRDMVVNVFGATIRNIGFNVNYKYVQGYLFEGSPQFTGFVPEYDMVDAQINYTVKKIYTTFKLGASNLLDNQRFQVYGGPRIGRMTYFSVLVDIK